MAQICILAAKTERTLKKQMALMDIECLLSDGGIIKLIKQTMNNEIGGDSVKINHKILLSCAEFVFGAKYILPNMKGMNWVYNELKQNGEIMRDHGLDEYCQFLEKGDNAFDHGKPIVDVIESNLCDFCPVQAEKFKEYEMKMQSVKDGMESLKDIVYALRVSKNEERNEVQRIKSEIAVIDKKMHLVNADIKEMDVEIACLKREIFNFREERLEKKGLDELDLMHWDQWSCLDLLHWIFEIENGMFLKYEHELNTFVRMENIRGSELHLLNEDDLRALGIKNEKERNRLIHCIKALVNNEFQKKAYIEPGSLQHEGIIV